MALSYRYCTTDDVKAKLLGLDVSDIPNTLLQHLDDQYISWAQRDVDSFCSQNFDATTVEEFYNGTGSSILVLNHRPIREVLDVTLYLIPSAQWYQFKRPFYVQTTNSLGIKVARQGGVEPKNAALTDATIPIDNPYIFAPGLGFANEDASPSTQTADFINNDHQYGRSDLFINTTLGTITIPPRILFLEGQAVPFFTYTFLRGIQNVRIRYTFGYSDPSKSDDLIDSASGNLPPEITEATASLAAAYILKDKGLFMSSGATSVTIDGVSKNYGELPYAGMIKYLQESAYRTLGRYKKLGIS